MRCGKIRAAAARPQREWRREEARARLEDIAVAVREAAAPVHLAALQLAAVQLPAAIQPDVSVQRVNPAFESGATPPQLAATALFVRLMLTQQKANQENRE